MLDGLWRLFTTGDWHISDTLDVVEERFPCATRTNRTCCALTRCKDSFKARFDRPPTFSEAQGCPCKPWSGHVGVVSDQASHPLDQTIASVVSHRDCSVRLKNYMAANPAIGSRTLRDILANPAATRQALLAIRNSGRLTANELLEMARVAAAEPPAAAVDPDDGADAREGFLALLQILGPIRFPADILKIAVSTRLRTTLTALHDARANGSHADAKAVPGDLGKLIEDWPTFSRQLRKQGNVGQKTIAELEGVIEGIVGRTMELLLGRPAGSAITMSVLAGKRLDPSFRERLVAAVTDGAVPASARLATLLHGNHGNLGLPPRGHVDVIIATLPEKERDTIARRFGLHGLEPQTLERIASDVYVTRERVRQIEAKALERLRIGQNRLAFERLVQAESNDVWKILSDGRDLILLPELNVRRHDISPHFHLAVEVCHGRLVNWLDSVGQPYLGGWLRPGTDPKRLKASVSRVSSWSKYAISPVPLGTACEDAGIATRDFLGVLPFASGIRIFEDYVCVGHLGSQARRTCRLHRLSMEKATSGCFDLSALGNAYSAAFPEDGVSPRVILLQLLRAPHLFFRLFDSVWMIVGRGPGVYGATLSDLPSSQPPTATGADFEVGSIGDWLYEVLKKNGLCRTVELRRLAQVAYGDSIAQSSVGAVLQSNPEFARVAPGVYGLQGRSPAGPGAGGGHAALLSDTQCRYYSISRRAGDPISTYPAWGPEFEMQLCSWAFSNASDDGYRSLLAVAEPSAWPVGVDEAGVWNARKRSYGSFRLPVLEPPAEFHLPSGSSFLASAAYLVLTGSIAWTTVNRASQRRIDSTKAASTLELLVRFGMVSSAPHWQDRHAALPRAADEVAAIMTELSKTGKLSWDTGHLFSLRTTRPPADPAYFLADMVGSALAGGEGSAESGAMMGPGPPAPDVETVFDSVDWGAVFSGS